MILGILTILIWIISIAVIITAFIGGILMLKAYDLDIKFIGAFTIAGSLLGLMIIIGFFTGEFTWDHGLLQDGCYRVGHETTGKTTNNTFELITTCR